MSYILEALKKAEQKRSRGELPNLQAVTGSPSTASPKSGGMVWKRLLVLALLGNILVFLCYLGFVRKEPSSQIQADAVGASISEGEDGDKKGGANEDVPSTMVELQPPSSRVRKGVGRVSEQNSLQRQETEIPGGVEKPDPLPVIEPVTDLGRVLASEELPPAVQSVIPKMTMTLHFYVSDASARMVRINGRNFREGDGLCEEVQIAEITSQGVVFESAGYHFEVPGLMVSRH